MLSFRIALRYLFSKKSHRAVNIISAISIAGVAVATMAIVIVLSVFNGFSQLSESQMLKTNPDLKLTVTEGKTINSADSLSEIIAGIAGVKWAVPVIEERGMLVTEHSQIPVEFKAVGNGYDLIIDLNSVMIDGVYMASLDSTDCMQLSVGVANRTGLRPGVSTSAELYVPKRKGRINAGNPASSLRSNRMIVTGVIQTDQAEADNDRIIMPLPAARRLLDYTDEAGAIEIAIDNDADIAAVAKAVSEVAGNGYKLLDRRMQQADTFRMIEIEKWITFMMLVFILLIASFNIISTLSLLVIEKRSDSAILRALGLSRGKVRSVFAWLGCLITCCGGAVGIVAGIALSLLQQHFGLIKLAGDPEALTIDVYPVAVNPADIITVIIAIAVVSALTALSTRTFTKYIR